MVGEGDYTCGYISHSGYVCNMVGVLKSGFGSTREVNNRLTGLRFAHLVNYFDHPVN